MTMLELKTENKRSVRKVRIDNLCHLQLALTKIFPDLIGLSVMIQLCAKKIIKRTDFISSCKLIWFYFFVSYVTADFSHKMWVIGRVGRDAPHGHGNKVSRQSTNFMINRRQLKFKNQIFEATSKYYMTRKLNQQTHTQTHAHRQTDIHTYIHKYITCIVFQNRFLNMFVD